MNNQNRTADGKIATKKEAQRADCLEMVARLHAQAKAALKSGERELAKSLANKKAELRRAFSADYGEAA